MGTLLLTHDVASPLMPTNQEFTTWSKDDYSRHNDTLFVLQLVDGNPGDVWKSKSSHFRLVHVPTRVSMWTHSQQLPEWGFKQQEINGNKNPTDKSAAWFVNDVVESESKFVNSQILMSHMNVVSGNLDFSRENSIPREPKKMSFFKKFAELHLLMLQHNAGLTASHPYASGPINWPFLLSGISFWTENDTQKQIYLIGNIVGWWSCVVAISIYVGIVVADLLARRRGLNPVPDCKFLSPPLKASLIVLQQLSVTACGILEVSSCSYGRYITCHSSLWVVSSLFTTTFLRTSHRQCWLARC